SATVHGVTELECLPKVRLICEIWPGPLTKGRNVSVTSSQAVTCSPVMGIVGLPESPGFA
ncbi:MAG: hypothetical protein Q6L54_11365, partial [Gloeomargarita sp. HHBFW_bins_205]